MSALKLLSFLSFRKPSKNCGGFSLALSAELLVACSLSLNQYMCFWYLANQDLIMQLQVPHINEMHLRDIKTFRNHLEFENTSGWKSIPNLSAFYLIMGDFYVTGNWNENQDKARVYPTFVHTEKWRCLLYSKKEKESIFWISILCCNLHKYHTPKYIEQQMNW